MKTRLLICAAALSLAGCATNPPGTEGAGYGSEYTPVIDGVKSTKYYSDLDACRAIAKSAQDAKNNEVGQNMVAGVILGAIIGGALGGHDGAAFGGGYGAIAGAGGTAGNAVSAGRQIIMNCMSGRGWRVLG